MIPIFREAKPKWGTRAKFASVVILCLALANEVPSIPWVEPFSLAVLGIVLIAAGTAWALSFRHPRLKLATSSRYVREGDDYTVTWRFRGKTERIENLCFYLEKRDYGLPKSEVKVRSKFETRKREVLGEYEQPGQMRSGSLTFKAPSAALEFHSSQKRWIVWVLLVEAVMATAPKFQEVYELRIVPKRMG